jgi:hypothetical protein
MKPRLLALGGALFLLLGLLPGPALAVAPSGLDQSNTTLTGQCLSIGNSSALAQTFTAGQSGQLTEVDLYMSLVPAGTVTIEIEATTAGLPNGTILGTASATVGTSPGWVAFFFSSVTITAGTVYAIVIDGIPAGAQACIGSAPAIDYGSGSGYFTGSTTPQPTPTAQATLAPTAQPTLAPTQEPTPTSQAVRGVPSSSPSAEVSCNAVVAWPAQDDVCGDVVTLPGTAGGLWLLGGFALNFRTFVGPPGITPPPTISGGGSSSGDSGSLLWLLPIGLAMLLLGSFLALARRTNRPTV